METSVWHRRALAYGILAVALAVTTLPGLGTPALWDMDEGVNAECTREMMESGTWIVPTFNWELRTAKPILLYWIQRPAFYCLGPTEFAARFPAVLLALGTVLLTYELARRIFDPATGLLAGIVLLSTILFNYLSHAATPDAPLIFFTTAIFTFFALGSEGGGRLWWFPCSVFSACAVLTKGPVGLGLPGLVLATYFLWNRELRRLFWDRRIFFAALIFLLITGPWYGLVASETRGEWTRRFFFSENLDRFTGTKENHGGLPIYYLVVLIVGSAPWSCVIGVTLWHAVKATKQSHTADDSQRRGYRLLVAWFVVYLLFFSAARTKLPNYIAPLTPALAILSARWLELWRRGSLFPARWVIPVAAGGVALTGILFAAGMVVAGRYIPHPFEGLEWWAGIGVVPIGAALVLAFGHSRTRTILILSFCSVVFVALAAYGPPQIIARDHAAKELVHFSGAFAPEREIRLASYEFFQESLVFYSQRKVSRGVPIRQEIAGQIRFTERPFTPDDLVDFLASPLPSLLFIPEESWETQIVPKLAERKLRVRIVVKKYDFYRNKIILAVTNE